MEIRDGAAGRKQSGGKIDFAPVSLTTLVDSPVIAGEYLREMPLDTLVAARAMPISSATRPPRLTFRRPDARSGSGSCRKPTRCSARAITTSYHFLLTLSDRVAHFGLEHHQSNDSRVPENSLTQPNSHRRRRARIRALVERQVPPPRRSGDARLPAADGRRAALGLRRADAVPRATCWPSGAASGASQYYKERLAQIAAYLDNEPGREWRPLADTTTAAQLLYFAPAAVGRVPPQHRLLRRRLADLARRRHADPPADRRPEIDRGLLPSASTAARAARRW